MNKNEFDNKIKDNIGGFLSVNSFFSTSTYKEVALMFAGNSLSNDSNIESVLFEIKINTDKCCRPFANIKHLSHMEQEDEILFSIATVFRIGTIHRLYSEGIWMVCLTMDGEEDEELNVLADNIKIEIGQSDSLLTFCGLLMKMGDLEKAEQYTLMLIKDTQDDNSLLKATYYSNLSMIYNEQMNYDAALIWAEKALQLHSSDLTMLTTIYTNIGLSYAYKNNIIEAVNYLHKTINIYKDILPPNHPKLIPTYMNLSLVYEKQKNFSKSIEYLLKIIEVVEKSFSTNHPTLAMAYSHLGFIYSEQCRYDLALIYLLKCLDIQQRALPSKHPQLVHTYISLGLVYLKQSNDIEAYNSCQKAMDIIGSSLDYPNIAMIMYILGEYHKGQNNLSDAINYFYRALNTQTKSTLCQHGFKVHMYSSLGLIYFEQKEWRKALDCYQKAIPIAMTCNHNNLAIFYHTVAFLYSAMGNFEAASRHVELALDVARRILPSNHPYIQLIEDHRATLKLFCN